MKMRRDGNRAFLEFAREGCGAGCKYCYIVNPHAQPRYFEESELEDFNRQLRQEPTLSIAAIGCDTDPFATDTATRITLRYLETCAELDLAVQISTKFPLPGTVLEVLESWGGTRRPVVFTTITTVDQASNLEPGAPDPATRAENFRIPRNSWLSAALIKPVLSLTDGDTTSLVNLIVTSGPDAAVVGARYRNSARKTISGGMELHPFTPNWAGSLDQDRAHALRRMFEKHGLMTFFNTECVVDFFNRTGDGVRIKRQFPILCVECARMC